MLRERWGTVARLAKALLEHETVERPEIDRLVAETDAGIEVPCADEVAAWRRSPDACCKAYRNR